MKRIVTSILLVFFIILGTYSANAATPSNPHSHKETVYSDVSVKSQAGYAARIQVYDDINTQIYNSDYLYAGQTRKIDLRSLGLEDGETFYVDMDLGSVNMPHKSYGPAIYCPVSNRDLALKIWGTIFNPRIGLI